jgi:hypothetical protein
MRHDWRCGGMSCDEDVGFLPDYAKGFVNYLEGCNVTFGKNQR